MNAYGLTLTEIGTLILISEGKRPDEIVEHGFPSMDKFNATIKSIMNKTNASTWKELEAIGSQLVHISKTPSKVIEPAKIANDYDDLLKEHVEAFCDLYDLWVTDHKSTCEKCFTSLNGKEFICPNQRELLDNKIGWMYKLKTML